RRTTGALADRGAADQSHRLRPEPAQPQHRPLKRAERLIDMHLILTSWPGLSRPSTSFTWVAIKTWMPPHLGLARGAHSRLSQVRYTGLAMTSAGMTIRVPLYPGVRVQ